MVFDSDNTYQILKGEKYEGFKEIWTDIHPDKTSHRHKVFLIINNTVVDELDFISMDGGRYFVPMTKVRMVDGRPEYYWNINSLSVKVCRIIGEYYRDDDLEGVASFSNVVIEDIKEE